MPTLAPSKICYPAFAKATDLSATCFANSTIQKLVKTQRIGWTNGFYLQSNSVIINASLFMNPENCDDGTLVGYVTIQHFVGGQVYVKYNILPNFSLKDSNLYVGDTIIPKSYDLNPINYPFNQNKPQFLSTMQSYTITSLREVCVYIIAFATICF